MEWVGRGKWYRTQWDRMTLCQKRPEVACLYHFSNNVYSILFCPTVCIFSFIPQFVKSIDVMIALYDSLFGFLCVMLQVYITQDNIYLFILNFLNFRHFSYKYSLCDCIYLHKTTLLPDFFKCVKYILKQLNIGQRHVPVEMFI